MRELVRGRVDDDVIGVVVIDVGFAREERVDARYVRICHQIAQRDRLYAAAQPLDERVLAAGSVIRGHQLFVQLVYTVGHLRRAHELEADIVKLRGYVVKQLGGRVIELFRAYGAVFEPELLVERAALVSGCEREHEHRVNQRENREQRKREAYRVPPAFLRHARAYRDQRNERERKREHDRLGERKRQPHRYFCVQSAEKRSDVFVPEVREPARQSHSYM